jgi:peptidoglycan/xylan/chitin deacetylase (PgdA/CDA1 family)
MHDGTLPQRAVSITFDDGFADNCTIALPILRRMGLHATFFIATNYLDGGRMWNDTVIEALAAYRAPTLDLTDLGLGRYPLETPPERTQSAITLLRAMKYLPQAERLEKSATIAAHVGAPLPNDLMLTTAQLRQLHAAGMEIGAHTLSHPILARVADDDAEREISGSRARLSELLQCDIRTFAYPNGQPEKDYTARDVSIVRRLGFDVGVSTAWGYADARMDRHQLARIAPWESTPVRFGLRVARSFFGVPPRLV